MQQHSKFSGSSCQRCGAERAVWPDMHDDELHCVICGATYYVTRVQRTKPAISQFVADASARQEQVTSTVVRSRPRRVDHDYFRAVRFLRN